MNDDLYDQAKRIVITEQTASVSFLQRRFSIGYSRAARMIAEMETERIVGPFSGVNKREVLYRLPVTSTTAKIKDRNEGNTIKYDCSEKTR